MKKLLSLLLGLILFIFSCTNKNKNNKIDDNISNIVSSFNVTSKDSKLTSNSGEDVALNEMITINVKSGEKILFKNFYFTLNNEFAGGLNFFSEKGVLKCTAPTKLSIMSMPPNGDGLIGFNTGDIFEVKNMTLIKINSINFVISNINFK